MNSRVLLSHRARRIFIWLHLWLGLILGLWFSLIGISGSVLAWRTELGAWELARRFPIATPAPNAKMLGLDAATAKLQTAMPRLDMAQISAISPPKDAMDSYKFTVGRSRRDAKTVVIDSYSGSMLGVAAPRSGNVFVIQNFHQRLIAGVRGYFFNGFLTVMGIPLLLSGLWLWWPKNGKQLRARLTVKRGTPIHRRLYDLHNVMGIYLYSVLLVTTVTGALLVKNHLQRDGLAQVMQELREGETPQAPAGRGAGGRGESARSGGEANANRGGERGENARSGAANVTTNRGTEQARGGEGAPKVVPNGPRLSNDELLDRARVAAAGIAISRVSLPQTPDAPFAANYAVGTGFATGRTLYLNPYNGEVLPSKMPVVEANNVIRGLHLGDFGGVFVKIIYTLTGLMPLGLFVTGFWLWARKKFKKRARLATAANVRETVEV